MFRWRAFDANGSGTPGAYLGVPSLADEGIRIAFTARAGGESADPFASLNLSMRSGDDPALVRANRARALAALGCELDAWTGVRQVHGAGVVRVARAERGRGSTDPDDAIPEADALWTDEAGVALAVLTADCVPIALVDPQTRRIAVVHAGWRGLVAGVVDAAVAAFPEPMRARAFIGPAIGPCCYEVGADVAEPLASRFGNDVVRKTDVVHADLWRAAQRGLVGAGVTAISSAALCTRCEPHRFYSHRAGSAARQGLVAVLEA